MPKSNLIDRIVEYVSPRAGLDRQRRRIASELLHRHYEAAAAGRRTAGWTRVNSDAAAASGASLASIRGAANDLIRNNGLAESAVRRIVNHWVGTGIVAKPYPNDASVLARWRAWAESTECDADGRNDIYGLEKLVARTTASSGECIVRRRLRFPSEGLAIPMQLQVIEPDYLDTDKSGILLGDGGRGGRIVHGVEFDMLNRRSAYWLFSEHPGSVMPTQRQSFRVPAESVLHIFKQDRPGQIRGVSWFASGLLAFKDYDKLADATLMKQLIAACLAIITTDVNGEAAPLGSVDSGDPLVDKLEPGIVMNAPAGRDVKVVNPPTVSEYPDFEKSVLRRMATGLGVTYEDLTGDYGQMPFSAARMSKLSHWADVDDWRYRIMIPQFCDPVWRWAMQAAVIIGQKSAPAARWTAPPAPMIDPAQEGKAAIQNVRGGLQSWSEMVRERGYDPAEVRAEIEADNAAFDDAGIILDSDPRNTSQSGGPRYFQDPELTDAQIAIAKAQAAKTKADAKNPPAAAPPAQMPQKPGAQSAMPGKPPVKG